MYWCIAFHSIVCLCVFSDDWDRWFLPGIVCRAGSQTDGPVHKEPGTVPKSHLLEPLTLTLLYLRRGSQERVLAGDALHEASKQGQLWHGGRSLLAASMPSAPSAIYVHCSRLLTNP